MARWKEQSKARRLAKNSGVDVEMIERYDPNYYKPKKKQKSVWDSLIE